MQTVQTHGSFEEAISQADPRIQTLVRSLRDLIADVYPQVVEVPWPKQRIIGYGIGPKKMSEHFCYLAVQKDYANLGFNYGAALPDPEHLLEGSGKEFRHVKILNERDLRQPALRKLLEARTELNNLLSYMDGKTGAENLLAEMLKDPAMLKALASLPRDPVAAAGAESDKEA